MGGDSNRMQSIEEHLKHLNTTFKDEQQPYQMIDGVAHFAFVTEEEFMYAQEMPVKKDDLFVVTPPKCGTTWVQKIVQSIRTKGEKPEKHVFEEVPFLELYGRDYIEKVRFTDPNETRVIKMHTKPSQTPGANGKSSVEGGPKYIFCYRNGKDAAVSYFHHARAVDLHHFDRNWDYFFERLMDETIPFGNYFDVVGDWYKYCQEHPDTTLMLSYEEMKKDPADAIKKIGKFMGGEHAKTVENEESLKKILELSSFSSMKESSQFPAYIGRKKDEAKHIRKGEIGGWKEVFSEQQNERFNAKCKEKLGSVGIKFQYLPDEEPKLF